MTETNRSVAITVRDGDREVTFSREHMGNWPGHPVPTLRELLAQTTGDVDVFLLNNAIPEEAPDGR